MAEGPAEIAHGPMFIGVIFNILLYGIMVTQTFLYFTTYKKDRLWMKFFVTLLFIADTVNAVFDLVYLYDSLVIHFDDVPFLATANWVFATDPAMTGIIASLVQFFFAWRVKILTSNIWTVVVILACAITGMLCSIATSVAIGIVPEFVNFQKFKVVVIIWLVAASVGDVIITFSLVWHLRRHKTGFAATDDIVNRIIRMTVQTGLITAVWAIIDLVVFLVDPTGTHLIFNMPLSKLYTNSLMSSLNSRGGWNFTRSSEPSQNERGLKSTTQEATRRADVVQLGTRPEVFVHVESHEMVDVTDKPGKSIFTDQELEPEYQEHKLHREWESPIRKKDSPV